MERRILFLSAETDASWTLIAEAVARVLLPDEEVHSAEVSPHSEGELPAVVARVLAEIGLSTEGIKPSPLSEDVCLNYDVVVLDSEPSADMLKRFGNAAIICPVAFPLPTADGGYEERLAAYRKAASEIREWILSNLTTSGVSHHPVDRALQLITWIDDRRRSLYDRSSITLAADTILAGAASLLLSLVPTVFSDGAGGIELACVGYLYISFLSFALVILLASIALATAGLGNTFHGRRDLWKNLKYTDQPTHPDCFPFYPPSLDREQGEYREYRTKFVSAITNDAKFIESAAVHFRVTCREFSARYKYFRRAVRLLLVSILPFLLAVCALIWRLVAA
ncbi:MAG: hypothetical protein V3T03_00780 [Candidatus Bipolaricaulota bacterium]